METLKNIKDLVEKMSVDTQKVYDKGNRSASIRARKYAQEINAPAFVIFGDRTLMEMSHFYPRTGAELLMINGVSATTG